MLQNVTGSALDFRISAIEIEACGNSTATVAETGVIPLFILGCDIASGLIPLYIAGTEPTGVFGTIPLFISGHEDNDSIPLFIHGRTSDSGNIPLFIEAAFSDSGNIPLFIHGHDTIPTGVDDISTQMPLFIKAKDGILDSGIMDLFLFSTENSGIRKNTTLFIDGTTTFSAEMPLFIQGEPQLFDTSSNMPLFIHVDGPSGISDELSLYLHNNAQVSSGNMDLFIMSPSGTEGAVPVSGNMPLFINRLINSTAHRFTMFIAGPSGIDNNIPLFIESGRDNNSLDLFIQAPPASVDKSIETYIHGF